MPPQHSEHWRGRHRSSGSVNTTPWWRGVAWRGVQSLNGACFRVVTHISADTTAAPARATWGNVLRAGDSAGLVMFTHASCGTAGAQFKLNGNRGGPGRLVSGATDGDVSGSLGSSSLASSQARAARWPRHSTQHGTAGRRVLGCTRRERRRERLERERRPSASGWGVGRRSATRLGKAGRWC
jgi:hypothetical protein